MKRRDLVLAATALPAAVAIPAWSQGSAKDWPTRPVKIVHGFTTGGPVDLLARLVASRFSDAFGQQAIVEGKPGAGGTIGANYVARAEPDGYTLFLMASGHSAAPGLYPSLPFDPVNDFTMISMVARSPFAIIANPQASFKTVQELVQQARSEPGKINYGSGGQGSGMHLTAVLMQSRLNIQLTHVPYKGGGAVNAAVMGGEVPVIFTSLAGMKPLLDARQLRGLAVTSKDRYPDLPDMPTVAETVLPGFDVSAWYAVAGPRNLPPEIVRRIHEMLLTAFAQPEVLKTLRAQSAQPWTTLSPQDAQAFLATDVSHWTEVIRAEKIVAPT